MNSSQSDKLEKLYQEGKISDTEYQELKKNIPTSDSVLIHDGYNKNPEQRPWQIWTASIFLVIVGIIQLGISLTQLGLVLNWCINTGSIPYLWGRTPVGGNLYFIQYIIMAPLAVLEIVVGIKLFHYIKWAYRVILFFSILSITVPPILLFISILSNKVRWNPVDVTSGILSFIINLSFFMLLINLWKYFFKVSNPTSEN